MPEWISLETTNAAVKWYGYCLRRDKGKGSPSMRRLLDEKIEKWREETLRLHRLSQCTEPDR